MEAPRSPYYGATSRRPTPYPRDPRAGIPVVADDDLGASLTSGGSHDLSMEDGLGAHGRNRAYSGENDK